DCSSEIRTRDHIGGSVQGASRTPSRPPLAFCARRWNYGVREAAMAAEGNIDWSECPLVEVTPRVQSGAPVLRGTRMPVNAIVDNFDYGVSVAEISEQFELA